MSRLRHFAALLSTVIVLALVPNWATPSQAQTQLGIITGIQGNSGEASGSLTLQQGCFFICAGPFFTSGGFSMLDRWNVGGVFLGTAKGSAPGQPVDLNGIVIYLAQINEPFPLQFPAITGVKARILDETVGTFTVDIQHAILVFGDGTQYRGPLHAEQTHPETPTLSPFTITRI